MRVYHCLVIRSGFEPETHSLEGCCSIQLSYQTLCALAHYPCITCTKSPMQAHKMVPTKAIRVQKYCFFLNYANIFAKIYKNITKVAQKAFASQVCEWHQLGDEPTLHP